MFITSNLQIGRKYNTQNYDSKDVKNINRKKIEKSYHDLTTPDKPEEVRNKLITHGI